MLSKKNRISKKEAEELFRFGKIVNSNNVFLKFLKKTNKNKPKLAFSVPKNIVKKANKRNLLRRRGYLVTMDFIKNLPNGLEGIFVFKNQALKIFGLKKTNKNNPLLELKEEIKTILKKI